jgi:hypothetical protein
VSQRDRLQGDRLTAEKRLRAALLTEARARRTAEVESIRITWLDGLLSGGRGHLFTPMPEIRPSSVLPLPVVPSCRLCRVPVTEELARSDCPGDQHWCPEIIHGQESTRARDLGDGRWLCGQTGDMTRDGRLWTCHDGHVTGAGHVARWRNHAATCAAADTGCPWDDLAKDNQ